jgi:hypothetical protein
MMLTENQLRALIRKQITAHNVLFENTENVSPSLDKADDAFDVALEHLKGPIEKIFNDETAAMKQKMASQGLDEGDPVTLGISLALASPFFINMIGKGAKLAAKAFAAVDKHLGGNTGFYDNMGPEWEKWWADKSHALHHFFIDVVKVPVGMAYKVAGIEADADTIKKTSELLFTLFVAYLLVQSGMGLIKALAGKSFGLAGLEGALSAIKSGEVAVYIRGVLAKSVGMAADAAVDAADIVL